MKKGYLFIANGTKPTIEQAELRTPVPIGSFGMSSVEAAKALGYSIFLGINRFHPEDIECTNYPGTLFYDQHCYRSPFALKDNWIAYKHTCKLLSEHPEIEVIHCNTPVGGLVGRLCGRRYKKKVIYTVHGFHFYKGASLINRTVFKWLEQLLAHFTDAIITINKEDYEAAQRLRYKKGGRAYYVPGVGVNLDAFDNNDVVREDKLKELGIPKDSKVGIVVGDLNDNKNVETIVRSLPHTDNIFHLLVCGIGPKREMLEQLAAQSGVAERIHFLGFRKDVKELLQVADVFLMASKREGLPRSTMEAMAAGLPCVVSDIRGNRDLVDEQGGVLVGVKDADGYAKAINRVFNEPGLKEKMGEHNKVVIRKYGLDNVTKEMINIFRQILNK